MNIMIAADYKTPQSGNFIASVVALSRRLRSGGNDVLFVFPAERKWVNWLRDEKFNVVILDEKDLSIENQITVLKELIRKYKIELIHTHFGMFHHAITHNRSEIGNVKIIIHDHMDFEVASSYTRQYIYTVLRSADYSLKKLNVISVMQRKNDAYWFLKNKWYIPNGLSLERYVDHSMTKEECRESLGVKDTDIVCLLLGWHLKGKGLDIALKAVNECRKTNPHIILGIIGAGRGKPSDYAQEFIKSNTDIDPNEPWIKYFNDYEDMYAVHRAIDVYISASRMDAFSYGLLEAISQGTPVVVSDIPGTKWSDIYKKSFFYPVEDYNKCADAIIKAIEVGRAESNEKEVIDKYSIDQWCDQIIAVYKKVMNAG